MCFIPNRDEAWMKQIARNLTDAEDGCLVGKRYVVMDRDGKFRPAFRAILKTERVEAVLLPPRSPNLNAHLERFHRSLKVECTRRLPVSFRAETFRQELLWFAACYNQHRPHAALGGRTPDEVYFPQRPASQSPRFEPRALWPRPAPCALPQVLVKGQPGARIELAVSYQHRRKHLPVATIRRAARTGSPASPSLSSSPSLCADPRTGSLPGSIRGVEPLLPVRRSMLGMPSLLPGVTIHPECDRRICPD